MQEENYLSVVIVATGQQLHHELNKWSYKNIQFTVNYSEHLKKKKHTAVSILLILLLTIYFLEAFLKGSITF